MFIDLDEVYKNFLNIIKRIDDKPNYDKIGELFTVERKWIKDSFTIPKKCLKEETIQSLVEKIKEEAPYDFYIYSVELSNGLYKINYKYEETDSQFRKRLKEIVEFKFSLDERGMNLNEIDEQIKEYQSKIDRLNLMKDLPIYK